MNNRIVKKSKEIESKLISHRRYLHSNPEIGFDTAKTSNYIYETLCAKGIECSFISHNMVTGEIRGKHNSKTILLRADIDALPIKEKTTFDYTSKNGNMHACGHDMHTSMLLGALEIIEQEKDNLNGNVRFLFQPAEETLSGAKCAIENGVLNGVDMAMTVHVVVNCDTQTGSVLLSYDTPSAPSADFFTLDINGKGCHGSSPSIGIDPITCTCRIVTALEHIRAYEIGIHDKALLSFGKISGGSNANAIPDKVTLMGTLRCFDEEIRSFYKKRFEDITNGISSSFGCTSDIKYTSGCPTLINDENLLRKTCKNLEELLGQNNVIKITNTHSKIQGSEDFAYISQTVPSVTVAIAAGSIRDGYKYPLHNQSVTFDENSLVIGCSVFAYNVLKLLEN